MDSAQSEAPTKINDDAYLRILQVDQEHSNSRWTLTTFFMSVSFAILGFSFQDKLAPSTSLAIRISGLLIYWFAFVLFQRFLFYNKILRTYLLEMEKSRRTSFDIQGRTNVALQARPNKLIGSGQLLMYFGLLYTVGVVLLKLLGL
jgi:hypothetical protein